MKKKTILVRNLRTLKVEELAIPCDDCEYDTRPRWKSKECRGCHVPDWHGYKKQECVLLL